MKVVILAGGLGTRLSEETAVRPKPMIDIGGRPLLWHIMKNYEAHGLCDFIICCGYKGYVIKEFFANYFLHTSDVTFDFTDNSMDVHTCTTEPWRVTLVDTGETSQTGGRLRRVAPYLMDDDAFCFTYGDGVADVDVTSLVDFHRARGGLATMTVVRPPGRFGAVELEDGNVSSFKEKPAGDGNWINGGFFVLSPEVIDFIEGDHTIWEAEPLHRLAREGQLSAFHHHGIWQPVDTLREKMHLTGMWERGELPWKAA